MTGSNPAASPHRGRAVLGRSVPTSSVGRARTCRPCCCPACRPTPRWSSSTASSGRPAGQVHRRLRPGGRARPPSGRRARRSVVLPHSRLNAVPRGGRAPPATTWPCTPRGGLERGHQDGRAGPRSCWSRVIPSTSGTSLAARVPAGRAALRAATSATNCPASPVTAWPARRPGGLRRLHERVAGGERDPALVERLPVRRGRRPGPLAVAAALAVRLYARPGWRHHPEEERLSRCTTRPSPSTADTQPTARGPSPCPSTRPSPTTSSTPTTPAPSSTSRCPASTTTGSTTRPTTSSNSGSPPSKGGRRPWWWPRAWPPSATPS